MDGRRVSERLVARAAARAAGEIPATRRSRRASAQTRPALSEYALHRTVAELLDWVIAPPALWTTFPSGWGKMTPAMAGMLYACGLKRGMPDLMVFPGQGRLIGIELKRAGGRPSRVQREMAAKLVAVGIACYIAHTPDEVLEILHRENVPLRAKTTMNAELFPCAS